MVYGTGTRRFQGAAWTRIRASLFTRVNGTRKNEFQDLLSRHSASAAAFLFLFAALSPSWPTPP